MRRASVLFSIRTLLLLALASVGSYAVAQQTVAPDKPVEPGDTIKNVANSGGGKEDSLQAIRLKDLEKKSDLKTSITYKAEEYMLLDLETKTLYLHKAGALKYDQMTLDADSLAVNWDINQIYADGLLDSTGKKIGRPLFAENEQSYNADRMSYNFKTKRGLVQMARTKQDENYIIGEYVKKQDDSTYYIRNGKFTSCDLEHPHYYIKSSKLKVIPRSKIITGPLMLVIEDFPLPLVVPFGFFPNQTGHRSGLVMPTYGESADRGFFLRNGGYYFAISDHVDLLVRGDIFSKGGYRLELGSAYNKRYRYQGNFQVEYGVQKFGERDDPEGFFKLQKNFWVKWSHDQTITPQAKLTANVSAGSSGFLGQNSYNEQEYLTNTLKSTVSFTQGFANSPWRFNLNLDHSQNTGTKQVTMELPNLALTRPRFFPFKGKYASGDHWYHQIGMNYTLNVKNQISGPDSVIADVLTNPFGNVTYVNIENQDTSLVTQSALDYFNNGISHVIPISTQLNLFKYINIQPSFNYKEYWYFRTRTYYWDQNEEKVDYKDNLGFAAARDFNFNVSASTRIYGLFGGKGKRQTTVRHTFQPNTSYTYRPDFSDARWGFYQQIQKDTTGETDRFNRFSGGIMSSPGRGQQQTVSLGLNNILEMKYIKRRNPEDTTQVKDPYTRITLLDALGLNTSYNFAADSLKLAPLSFIARTNFLNNKFNFQLTGNFDPYAVNAEGVRIDTFRYALNGNVGRISNLNFTFNTTLAAKNKTAPMEKRAKDATPEELSDLRLYRDLYVDFNVPWRLSLSANLIYRNSGIRRDTTFTVNMSGDVNLTPKWKLGYTTGYDFKQKDFSYTSVSIYRDLHCWEMSLTWIPFGLRKSYNFSINVKSSTLKDLKLTKRRDWQDRF